MFMQLGGYSENTARYRTAAKPLNDNFLTESCMSLANKENEALLSQKTLKALIHYDESTGFFIWRYRDLSLSKDNKRWNSRFAGRAAGSVDAYGYFRIMVNGVYYKSHRLAWLYVYGVWPRHGIDHANQRPADNRISNLRDADCIENGKNHTLSIRNKSGVTGVCQHCRTHMWHAAIHHFDKMINLGTFVDKFEAICARKSANNKYGFSSNHGSPKQ